MLSEKQFRERTRSELRQIAAQARALAADRDLYRRLERDIIENNPQLNRMRSPMLDMLRGCYADAMSARVLRLLAGDGGSSLADVLARIAQYPQLLEDKMTEREFADDRAALARATANLQRAMVPHVDHHERTLSALASVHRELDGAIELLVETVKTYYWIVAGAYVDLEVKYSADPLSVFQFAWATPLLTR